MSCDTQHLLSSVDVLRAARKLIEVPERWTQGAEARDADGRVVWPSGEAAVCWCARGAVLAHQPRAVLAQQPQVFNLGPIRGALRELDAAAVRDVGVHPVSVALFNDDPATTHAQVLALFDDAIEAVAG